MGLDDEMCRIDIRDEGAGIPAGIRDRVFEPFFTTKVHGGGLGLAVASRTATLHGGSLTFECPATGGTIMTMRLPVRPSVALTEPTPKVPAAVGLQPGA